MPEQENAAPATDTTASTSAASAAPVAAPAAPAADPAPAAATSGTPAPATTAAPAEPAAPEKYEFATLEGVTLDKDVLTEFEGVAKELKLSNEAANKILGKVAPKIAAQQAAAFKTTVEGWTAAVKADKELGGEKLDANLAIAKRAMSAYAKPEFAAFLKTSGLGSHPEMVRMLHKIGLTVSEDTVEGGRQPSGNPNDARGLYPKSNMNA